jgi:hypothetical protein
MNILVYYYCYYYYILSVVGQDSVVGIATRYGLDGPGIESRWGRNFPHPSRQALGLTHPPIQWVTALTTHHHLAPRLKKE